MATYVSIDDLLGAWSDGADGLDGPDESDESYESDESDEEDGSVPTRGFYRD